MKKILWMTVTGTAMALAGCQSDSYHSDADRRTDPRILDEAAGAQADWRAQSHSSSPNPASSHRNVGQSGDENSPGTGLNPKEEKSSSNP